MLNPDFSLASSVLAIQRTALDQLMGDGVAARLADAESKVADRRQLLSLAEVHARIADSVWSELKTGAEIDSLRRNLQREHVRRVATGLVRPSSAVAADVRAVNRQVAVKLQADLQRALGNSNLSADDARAPRGEREPAGGGAEGADGPLRRVITSPESRTTVRDSGWLHSGRGQPQIPCQEGPERSPPTRTTRNWRT